MLTIIFTNLRRRPTRTALTAAGIAVGVATIVALLSFTQGLSNTAAGLTHLGGSDLGVFQANVSDPTASILPTSLVGRLERKPYVSRATSLMLMVEAMPAEPGAVVFGAQPSGFFWSGLVIVAGHAGVGGITAGGSAAGPAAGSSAASGTTAGTGILLGSSLAGRLHLSPGGHVVVKGRRFTVTGVYHSGILFEDSGAVLPLSEAQRIAGRSGETTSIAVDLSSDIKAASAARQIVHDFPGTQVISTPDQALRAGANGTLISKAILVIVVIALIVGAIGVTNTMALAIVERQSELGLLSTVGWSPLRVASLILGEGVAVSVIGAAVGLLLGVIGAGLLVHVLGVSSYVAPSVTAWGLGRGLLVGVAIGVLGDIYPAWRVTRMQPLKALSGT